MELPIEPLSAADRVRLHDEISDLEEAISAKQRALAADDALHDLFALFTGCERTPDAKQEESLEHAFKNIAFTFRSDKAAVEAIARLTSWLIKSGRLQLWAEKVPVTEEEKSAAYLEGDDGFDSQPTLLIGSIEAKAESFDGRYSGDDIALGASATYRFSLQVPE